jgi:lipopolysaccharide transport system ATP-binding protein
MSDLALRVEGLGKQYRLGRPPGHRTLREALSSLRGGGGRSPDPLIWALQDVSFELARGEVLGVIGSNGAGKSTLLKILSRVTEPSAGEVVLYGRIGSLLEVGTGFHPELTGRENIYLNGAILGMKRAEIDGRFDEIVAFAEVAEFLDTPVKRYSSGMYLRLAFAVAAHLEPEILVVDEVLAVGDVAFQRKCLGKMQEVSRGGRTVLFVSHNLAAVGRLCSRALYLKKGRSVALGETSEVVHAYLSSVSGGVTHREWPDPTTAPGDEYLRLTAVRLLDERGQPLEVARQDQGFQVAIAYRVLQPMPNANVGIELRTEGGVTVLASYDADHPDWSGRGRQPGAYLAECSVPAHLLNEGAYQITITAGIPFQKVCLMLEDLIRLEVAQPVSGQGSSGRMAARRPGVVAPDLPWRVAFLG